MWQEDDLIVQLRLPSQEGPRRMSFVPLQRDWRILWPWCLRIAVLLSGRACAQRGKTSEVARRGGRGFRGSEQVTDRSDAFLGPGRKSPGPHQTGGDLGAPPTRRTRKGREVDLAVDPGRRRLLFLPAGAAGKDRDPPWVSLLRGKPERRSRSGGAPEPSKVAPRGNRPGEGHSTMRLVSVARRRG